MPAEKKKIKFDFRRFGIYKGRHVTELGSFKKASEKVIQLQEMMLEGKASSLKDKDTVMTGWKTESPYQSEAELNEIEKTAQEFRKDIDDFVSIGIGGSYLGNKATIEAINGSLELFNLLPKEQRKGIPRIFFLGNHMDPAYIKRVLGIIDGKNVGINVISKSGGTVEPAIAFAIMQDHAKKIVAITDKAKGALKKLSTEKGYKTFDVPDNVGGRFSVTCPVGLFGLAVAGVDIKEFIAGARFGEEQTRKNPFDKNIALLRSVMRYLAYTKMNKKIELASTCIFDLKGVTAWMQQLGPESEGKNGQGLFVVPQFYTQDAHADGQMVQMGERNLIETFIMLEKVQTDIKIPAKGTPVDYVDGKPLSFVNQVFVDGLRDAHYEGGVPTMSYILPELDAFTLGQFYQLEMNTIALSGLLLGQNPFIQPGVQMYKDLANARLTGRS